MSEEKLRDVPIPQNLDDAITVAKSLVNWLEWIKKEGSMSSNGGWVDVHVSALKCFVQMETIKASADAFQSFVIGQSDVKD
jgi:hypothetical protein